jgi:hypothetical protein
MPDTGEKVKVILGIRPVHPGGTKQGASTFMVESLGHLHVPGERRIESLSCRNDPVQNRALEALGVVRSGTRHAFLDLRER